jgi:O-antigen/teichoic acid export membrane protein
MNKKISTLFSDSFAYSIGSVLSRFFTFWLLPLTTSYLTPADYGVIGNLALFSTLIVTLFQLGINTSIAPVYYSDSSKEPGVIWSAFLTLLVNSTILCALFGYYSEPLSHVLLNSPGHAYLVVVTLLTTAFSASQMPFMFYMRAKQKARLVAVLCIFDVVIANTLLVLFLIVWERGAAGVVEAQCLSTFFSLVIGAAVNLPKLPFSFPWNTIKELLKVGSPVIYGFLGFFLLQSSSRYMIQWYVSESEAGLFFVGSNFARVIELALWGFVSAWIPYFNSFAGKEEEGVTYFSKVLTYFTIGIAFISLCFFLFARPVVAVMVQAPFYPVWKIVGILSFAQASWGIYVISYTGMIMKKRTFLLSCMEIAAGICCIGFNALLIPIWQMEGAALATFLGFVSLIIVSFAVNRRILPVPYETDRLLKVAIPFCCIAAYSYLPIESLLWYVVGGISSLCGYGAYLWYGVLTKDEKIMLKNKLGWRTEPCVEYQQ